MLRRCLPWSIYFSKTSHRFIFSSCRITDSMPGRISLAPGLLNFSSGKYNHFTPTPNVDIVRSYPFSFGVFLNHYTTHEFSHVAPSTLTLVGSTCTGLMYFSSLIMLPVMNRYPWHKKTFMYVGVVLCIAGLVGAAFAKKAWHLILTQGVTYAVGGSTFLFICRARRRSTDH